MVKKSGQNQRSDRLMVKDVSNHLTMSNFDKLRDFRHKAYTLMGNGRDALFDLIDTVLVSRNIYSFAELSLSPVFRRQWPSLYEALQDSKPARAKLMQLYIEQIPQEAPVVLAGEHTAWSRLQAKTLRERTYEHQATPMSGAKPVTIGQGYNTQGEFILRPCKEISFTNMLWLKSVKLCNFIPHETHHQTYTFTCRLIFYPS